MDGLQACIYKDFTCIHKEILQRFGTSQKRLMNTSKSVQVSFRIKYETFWLKPPLVKESESLCENFADLAKA